MNPASPAPLVRARPRFATRLCASLCAFALGAPAAHAQPAPQSLPALGDSTSEDFGIGAERRLGDQIMREIRRDPDYIDDPVLIEYLVSIFQPLVARARALGNIGPDTDERFAWEPFLVRDRSVNAFALPGGYVGVHLGLIAVTSTRDELASVLAHELSHVTQRHIARSMVNSKRQSLIGIAALIVGVLAASRSRSTDAANAVITGGQAAAIQGQLNFSRDMEREADRIGFQLLSGAGFAPSGMAAMFEKLDTASHLNDSGSYPYLRSHPLTSERIGEARARLGAAPPAPPPASPLEHTTAQARSRVLADTRVDALRRSQSRSEDRGAESVADKLSAAYESALASTLLREWDRADAELAKAQAIVHGSPRSDARAERAVTLLAVQSLLERGAAPRAMQLLATLAGDASRPVALLRAQAAVALAASPQPDATALKRSADELQTWVAMHPSDATTWQTLSQVWARLAQPLRAVRAEAESRVALGDLNGAADRLHAGQRQARAGRTVDFIEASVIDSRLRDIEAQRRQRIAEERTQQQ